MSKEIILKLDLEYLACICLHIFYEFVLHINNNFVKIIDMTMLNLSLDTHTHTHMLLYTQHALFSC
jgi:hypothetical protein